MRQNILNVFCLFAVLFLRFMEAVNIIINILSILGALGLFLYGMKFMSESLQKVAGDQMRRTLSALTSNRFRGVMVGFLVTAIIQSSSATTVMLVSFVNAGLVSVAKSIAIIMGANIGTTITSWLVLIGLNVKISMLTLPIIGLGLPLFFSRKKQHKFYGELIIGIALLFLGLEFLKETLPDISENAEYFSRFSVLPHDGFWPLILFTFFGMLITIIIQSSSATMALTLVLCSNGWIPLEMGAAMILGENLGTTVTPNIAALMANKKARQSARIHFLFNILGFLWIIPLFYPIINGINFAMDNYLNLSMGSEKNNILISLAIFHTFFNVTNTLIMLNFSSLLERFSLKLVNTNDNEDNDFYQLKYIDTSFLSTSELSTIQAKKEIGVFAHRLRKMFNYIPELLVEKKDSKYQKLMESILHQEKITDHMEVEISSYLTRITESEMSHETSNRIRVMMKIIDDMESIGNLIQQIAHKIDDKNQKKVWFTQDIRNNLNSLFRLIDEAFQVMENNLNGEYSHVNPEKAFLIEEKINEQRDQMRRKHIELLEGNISHQAAGSYLNDIYSMGEKIGDYIADITEAVYEYKIMFRNRKSDSQ